MTTEPSGGDDGLRAAGDAVRRRVLGDEYVERSRQNATAFGKPMQELVTDYCWGAVWTRPGLPPATRSLINIALLTTLGRNDELRQHVRGALRNGCTEEEIQEVLLQVAVYCGVPAGLEGTRQAQSVLDELD
jgi:4-carboxymuconolactone decarboxylase